MSDKQDEFTELYERSKDDHAAKMIVGSELRYLIGTIRAERARADSLTASITAACAGTGCLNAHELAEALKNARQLISDHCDDEEKVRAILKEFDRSDSYGSDGSIVLAERAAEALRQARADRDNFKVIGKQFEEQATKHFNQSCHNLNRFEGAFRNASFWENLAAKFETERDEARADRDVLAAEVRAVRDAQRNCGGAECGKRGPAYPARMNTDASGALTRAGGGE